MTDEQKQIIAKIQAYRKENGMVIDEVAKKVGLSGSRMRGIFVGKPQPATVENLLSIANKLGIKFELKIN